MARSMHTRSLASLGVLAFIAGAACADAADRRPAPPGASLYVPLTVLRRGALGPVAPVTVGVPFPKGALASCQDLRLTDAGGNAIALQAAPAAAWSPSGPVKWALLDFQAPLSGEETTLRLHYDKGASGPVVERPVTVTAQDDGFRVNTGPMLLHVRRAGFDFIHDAWIDANGDGQFAENERVLGPAAGGGPYLVDARGKVFRAANDKDSSVTLEESGPLRACLKAQAWFVSDDGERLCQLVMRIHAFRGKPYVRVLHTFIFTADSNKVQLADIGVSVPIRVRSAAVGSDAPLAAGVPSLRLTQYEHDRHVVVSEGKDIASGGSAPGWMLARGERGAVTVAVRDFWRMYPKELEAGADGLVAHLWPAHNVETPPLVYTEENAGSLWFVHHGRLLDFRVPPEMSEFKTKFPHNYLKASAETNAMGVARTHEMLWWFQAPDETPVDGGRAQGLIQAPPLCVVDPRWVAATNAFGPIHHRDAEKFPEVERALSLLFDFERSIEEHNKDYGLFCYGNSHTYWSYTDKSYNQVDRPWRNMHHGGCRAAWLLYARSGDPKYLEYALRNTRFNLDVGICHYATLEFEDHPLDNSRKLKGALTDYKGIVPWCRGRRLADYNAMTDFMLYDYYVTGDRGGLDVAMEWGEAMKRHIAKPGSYGGRGWAGPCSALVSLYEATWDERLGELAQAYRDNLLASQREDGTFGGWANYAPWLSWSYWLTRDPKVAAAAVRWAESARRLNGLVTFEGYDYPDGFALYDVQAVAYETARDPAILADALGKMLLTANSVLDKPGSFAHGAPLFTSHSMVSYYAQTVPYILRPLASVSEPIEPLFPRWSCRFPLEGLLLDEDDREVVFEFGRRGPVQLQVVAPDGATVLEREYSGPPAQERFALAADGKRGVYRVSLRDKGGQQDVLLPMWSSRPVKLAYRMPQPGTEFPRCSAVYFHVPQGVDTVDIEMSGRPNMAFTAALFARRGVRLAARHWYAVEEPGPVRLRARVPEEHQGQTLCFLQGASKWLALTFVSPKPEYFGDLPDRLFRPSGAVAP